MTLGQLIIGWFYYGIFYMGLSVAATLLLNRVTPKLWLPPLLINAIAIVLLLISYHTGLVQSTQLFFSFYFVYMPIVAASICCNGVLATIKRYKQRKNPSEEEQR